MFTNKITASVEDLLDQASTTAKIYLYDATKAIDDQFGDGYAKEHPELVGIFMQVAERDFRTSIKSQLVQDAIREIVISLTLNSEDA